MRPRVLTDEALDAAAREVFLSHGPSSAVSLVAARLGVSPAAVFHRVGSKEALLRRALCPPPPPLPAFAEKSPLPPPDFDAQLLEHLRALLTWARRSVPGLVALRAAGADLQTCLPTGESPFSEVREGLAGWLERALPGAPEVIALAEVLAGALEARAFHEHVGGAPGTEDAAFLLRLVRLAGRLPPDQDRRRRAKAPAR